VLDTRRIFARLVDLGRRKGDLDPELDTEAVVHFCQAVAFGFLVFDAIDPPAPDDAAWAALVGRLVGALEPPPGHT